MMQFCNNSIHLTYMWKGASGNLVKINKKLGIKVFFFPVVITQLFKLPPCLTLKHLIKIKMNNPSSINLVRFFFTFC